MIVRNARVYKLTPYRFSQWAKKRQFLCNFCSRSFVVGDWVLVKSGSGRDKVRHLVCAVQLGICELDDLPEEARSSLVTTVEIPEDGIHS